MIMQLPFAGDTPGGNCIIVAGEQEEVCVQLSGGQGNAPVFSIDAWW
ncbi:hypothetical protein ACFLVC_01450 [Chloroflexota bacterium]